MRIDLVYPCGHTLAVAATDPRFRFGAHEARLVADVVLYCQACWQQDGRATWKEPGDYFAYKQQPPDRLVDVAQPPKGVRPMMIYVPLEQIDDNPWQARQDYGDVADLAADILRHRDSRPDTLGLQQVPTGRLVGDDGCLVPTAGLDPEEYLEGDVLRPGWRIQLEFGHRRQRAFAYLQQNGAYEYRRLPLILRDMSDEQMLDGVWSENAARKNLAAVEEAELLACKLTQVKASGGSQRDVAESWGLARPTIANKLRLLQLPPELQEANRDGRWSERVAMEILRVVDLQTATEGRNWGTLHRGYYNQPESPSDFIATVLAQPEKYTSEAIRDYLKAALRYAGEYVLPVIANHAVTDDQVRQSTCKGCPLRVNQYCLDKACLAVKRERFIDDTLAETAAQLGVQVSREAEDFDPFRYDYDAREQLAQAWGQSIPADYVVGWQGEGNGFRPYLAPEPNTWIARGDQFNQDGRAGIVLGVRGGCLSSAVLAALETQNPEVEVEDIPDRAIIAGWQKEAVHIRQQVEKRAREALADALYTDIATSERLQALILAPDATEIDSHEKFIQTLVKLLWEKGKGVSGSYYDLDRITAAEKLLQRARLSPTCLQAETPALTLRQRAIPILAHWYDRRTYSWDSERARIQAHLQWVLQTWPEQGEGDLQLLRLELDRAMRDIEKKSAGDETDAETDRFITEVDAVLAEVGV